MVDDLSIAEKHLHLIVSTFDFRQLMNLTINFEVIVHHKDTGMINQGIVSSNRETRSSVIPEKFGIISLCPVLGNMKALAYNGMCPGHTKSPFQKNIKVSFIGLWPYIVYNPIGGSDFILTRIFAKKHGFNPLFIPAKTFNAVKFNGTTIGMIHQVIKNYSNLLNK